MLKEFINKPQERLACVIDEKGKLEDLGKGMWKYAHKAKGCTSTLLEFKVGDAKPEAGDYIVWIDKTDIYHASKKAWEDTWSPKATRLG